MYFWFWVTISVGALAGGIATPFIIQWVDDVKRNEILANRGKSNRVKVDIVPTLCCKQPSSQSELPHIRDFSQYNVWEIDYARLAPQLFQTLRFFRDIELGKKVPYTPTVLVPVIYGTKSGVPDHYFFHLTYAHLTYNTCETLADLQDVCEVDFATQLVSSCPKVKLIVSATSEALGFMAFDGKHFPTKAIVGEPEGSWDTRTIAIFGNCVSHKANFIRAVFKDWLPASPTWPVATQVQRIDRASYRVIDVPDFEVLSLRTGDTIQTPIDQFVSYVTDNELVDAGGLCTLLVSTGDPSYIDDSKYLKHLNCLTNSQAKTILVLWDGDSLESIKLSMRTFDGLVVPLKFDPHLPLSILSTLQNVQAFANSWLFFRDSKRMSVPPTVKEFSSTLVRDITDEAHKNPLFELASIVHRADGLPACEQCAPYHEYHNDIYADPVYVNQDAQGLYMLSDDGTLKLDPNEPGHASAFQAIVDMIYSKLSIIPADFVAEQDTNIKSASIELVQLQSKISELESQLAKEPEPCTRSHCNKFNTDCVCLKEYKRVSDVKFRELEGLVALSAAIDEKQKEVFEKDDPNVDLDDTFLVSQANKIKRFRAMIISLGGIPPENEDDFPLAIAPVDPVPSRSNQPLPEAACQLSHCGTDRLACDCKPHLTETIVSLEDKLASVEPSCGKPHLEDHTCSPCLRKHLKDVGVSEWQIKKWKEHACPSCELPHMEDHICSPCFEKHLKDIGVTEAQISLWRQHICTSCPSKHLSDLGVDEQQVQDLKQHKCSPCPKPHPIICHICPPHVKNRIECKVCDKSHCLKAPVPHLTDTNMWTKLNSPDYVALKKYVALSEVPKGSSGNYVVFKSPGDQVSDLMVKAGYIVRKANDGSTDVASWCG